MYAHAYALNLIVWIRCTRGDEKCRRRRKITTRKELYSLVYSFALMILLLRVDRYSVAQANQMNDERMMKLIIFFYFLLSIFFNLSTPLFVIKRKETLKES